MNVIVVGAGPAGATAARVLARAGVTVRLLDRSKFPRNKPCGGGISLRVLRRFPYLERELGRIATHTVSRLHLEGPGGEASIIESDGPAALMIRRVEFDHLLVSLAQEAGASLVTGVDVVQASAAARGVTLTARDGARFHADVVIAADGVNSVIARRLGLNAGWRAASIALDMMEETPRTALRDVDPSALWVSYGYDPASPRTDVSDCSARAPASEGYAYVFPKRDHVNVGIGYVLQHYRDHIEDAPYDLQRGFIDHLRSRGVVEGNSVRANFTPFLIPVGGPLRRPGCGRVLLVGDAGGFVNGVTAEGIYYAMVTGELAARAGLDSRPSNAMARRHRPAWPREVGDELRDSVFRQRYLFADRRRIVQVVRGAARYREMTGFFLDFAAGRLSYSRLRRRLLLESPRLLGEFVRERVVPQLWSRPDKSRMRFPGA